MIDGVKPIYGTSTNLNNRSNTGGRNSQNNKKQGNENKNKETPAFEVILSREMKKREEGHSVKVLKR